MDLGDKTCAQFRCCAGHKVEEFRLPCGIRHTNSCEHKSLALQRRFPNHRFRLTSGNTD